MIVLKKRNNSEQSKSPLFPPLKNAFFMKKKQKSHAKEYNVSFNTVNKQAWDKVWITRSLIY